MKRNGGVSALEERQRAVWIAAILCYGVGDTVTTFWGLSTGGVAEAGPIAGPLMEAYGREALLGLKAVVFSTFYLVWSVLETPGRIAVPFSLVIVGFVVSAWNLVVIMSAL